MGRLRRAAVVAVAIGAVSAAVPPAVAAGPTIPETLLDLINRERAAVGAPALEPAPDLAAIAGVWAEVLAEEGELRHNADLAAQMCCHLRFSENVAWGGVPTGWLDRSVVGVHNILMQSPGHRRNILDPAFDQVGIGAVLADDVLWVVQDFRRHDGSATSSAIRPTTVRSPARPATHHDANSSRPGLVKSSNGHLERPDRAATVLARIELIEVQLAHVAAGT
ncbi:MAG: CAP domain-containing protein [Nitriliruptorales bacterium]|nr:CAP domain-containing protein [Nitriliruptorales bacterium]